MDNCNTGSVQSKPPKVGNSRLLSGIYKASSSIAIQPAPAANLATFKELGLRQMFMAMTVAKFRGNQMHVAAAGMPYTLVYRAASRSVEEIELKGMPLGSFSAFPYQEKVLSLNPGDTVLFMSDGFTEMFNTQNELLGEERAKELFQAAAEKSPQEVIAHLNRASKAFSS
ncbi:serine/threonine-protein phosphatase [candidate division KSB1 bacterium]|nr:serine/threonine-protein phosphatase [candidate division KSB1 bacterium]